MHLKQLRSFVRVCKLGSISRAATELHIAQPALGLQIRNLEYEFEAQLLHRTSRGVSPTPSGEVILGWAQGVLDHTEQVRQKVRDLQGNADVPTVTIGLTTSLAVLLVRPIVEATFDSKIKVKIVEGMSHSIAEWVSNRRIDIGLGFGGIETKGLQSVALIRERLFYVSGAGGGTAPITLAEVLAQPLAVPDEQNSIRPRIEAAASKIDMPLIGSYEVGSVQAAREIARSGKAGAITPYSGVAADKRSGELSVRLITEPMIERTLYMMRRSAESLTDPEIMLSKIIYAALQEVTQRDEFSDAYILLDDPRDMSNLWEDS